MRRPIGLAGTTWVIVLAFAAAGLPQPAFSQAPAWPARSIRFIIPYTPGGGADIIARLLGARLSESWGQQVIADNRPGGGTVIGADLTAKANPDGHTFYLNTAAHAINATFVARLPYDTLRDFAPITQLARLPNALVINPQVAAANVREFVDLARRQPGKLTYGSSGTGTVAHLAGELFRTAAKVDLIHVPYRGGSALMPDLIGGQIQATFATLPAAMQHVKSGRLRALAVASAARSPGAPDIPTIAESGYPGFDASNWLGLFAPAATPPALVARLHADFAAQLRNSEVIDRLTAQGFEAVGNTPAQFRRFVADEIGKWAKLVKQSGAKPD